MLSNYPQPEVRVFGERVASALMDANIRNSMSGLGGCKAFDLSDFDEDTHPYIQAYLEGHHDSVAVIYAAMRTLDKQLKKRCNAHSPAAELVAAAAQDTEAYLQDPTIYHAPEYFESVLAALNAAQTLLGATS